jgi:hypothetical protein
MLESGSLPPSMVPLGCAESPEHVVRGLIVLKIAADFS